MAIVKTDVSIAEKVTKETTTENSHVPGDGKTINVYIMGASVPDESDAVVQLVWDMGGAGEEILWTMQHGKDFINLLPPPQLQKEKT